jgi:hypothetical protein
MGKLDLIARGRRALEHCLRCASRMTGRRRAWLIAAVATVALGGCGEDKLSTRDLRSKATTICNLATSQTNLIAVPGRPAGAAAFVASGAATLRPQLAGLRALQAPGELAQVYRTALDALSRKLEALDVAARDLKAGSDAVITMKTLQSKLGPLESEEDEAWQTLEIPACVNR